MDELTNTTEPQIAYSECYVLPFFSFYNADNMVIMKTFKDKEFDLAIVDPPYGIGISSNPFRQKHKKQGWDNAIPNKEYFDELKRVSKNQIIWGGNYFNLPPSRCFIVWDKLISEDFTLAMAELAWTSFDKLAKIIRMPTPKDGKIHPTQKPIKLYRKLLIDYAEKGFKILDTHGGSFTNAIACDKEGFDLDICEIDSDYYKNGVQQFQLHKRQQVLF